MLLGTHCLARRTGHERQQLRLGRELRVRPVRFERREVPEVGPALPGLALPQQGEHRLGVQGDGPVAEGPTRRRPIKSINT